MKKLMALLFCLLLPAAALAEVHMGEIPADWADKPLLRVTILQTGRSGRLWRSAA